MTILHNRHITLHTGVIFYLFKRTTLGDVYAINNNNYIYYYFSLIGFACYYWNGK